MHCHAQNAECQVEVMAIYCLWMHLISHTFYRAFNFRASGLVRHWTFGLNIITVTHQSQLNCYVCQCLIFIVMCFG